MAKYSYNNIYIYSLYGCIYWVLKPGIYKISKSEKKYRLKRVIVFAYGKIKQVSHHTHTNTKHKNIHTPMTTGPSIETTGSPVLSPSWPQNQGDSYKCAIRNSIADAIGSCTVKDFQSNRVVRAVIGTISESITRNKQFYNRAFVDDSKRRSNIRSNNVPSRFPRQILH